MVPILVVVEFTARLAEGSSFVVAGGLKDISGFEKDLQISVRK
jgi:hypothetical protein